MRDMFSSVARRISEAVGSAAAFVIAFGFVIVWLAMGPLFSFSSRWQLLINTVTTIVTFLMVFVIQNAQNRDTRAIQIKLDELLRAVGPAMTGLVDIEKLSDDELKQLQERFTELAEEHAEETKAASEDLHEAVNKHEQVAGS